MQIAMIGLGKMGGNMVKRLLGGGHEVFGWDRDPAVVRGKSFSIFATASSTGRTPPRVIERSVSRAFNSRGVC